MLEHGGGGHGKNKRTGGGILAVGGQSLCYIRSGWVQVLAPAQVVLHKYSGHGWSIGLSEVNLQT